MSSSSPAAEALFAEFLTVGAFAENSYVVGCRATGSGVLVDPGGEVPKLLRMAADAGLEIEAIWLTHAHLDHVLGLPEALASTGAPIWLHRDDLMLYDAAPQQGEAFGFPIDKLPPVDEHFEAGQTLRLGELEAEVLCVPGHAPGHVAFWFEPQRKVIAGDVLFAGSIGRTDLPGGDYKTLMRSIREVILPLGDDVEVLPGHGPTTTVGEERKTNPFLLHG